MGLHQLIDFPLNEARDGALKVMQYLLPYAHLAIVAGFILRIWRDNSTRGILSSLFFMLAMGLAISYMDPIGQHVTGVVNHLVDVLQAKPSEVLQTYLVELNRAKAIKSSNTPWLISAAVESILHVLMMLVLLLFGLAAGVLMALAYVAQKGFYLFFLAVSPIALALLAFSTTRERGVTFFLHWLAVCMWPLGWGLTALVTRSLLAFSVVTVRLSPDLDPQLMGLQHLITILVLGPWIVLSTLLAPVAIQILMTSGGSSAIAFAPAALAKAVASGASQLGRMAAGLGGSTPGGATSSPASGTASGGSAVPAPPPGLPAPAPQLQLPLLPPALPPGAPSNGGQP